MKRRKIAKKSINAILSYAIIAAICVIVLCIIAFVAKVGIETFSSGYSKKLSSPHYKDSNIAEEANYKGTWVKHPRFQFELYMPDYGIVEETDDALITEQRDSKEVLEKLLSVVTFPATDEGNKQLEEYRTSMPSNDDIESCVFYLRDYMDEVIKEKYSCDNVYYSLEVAETTVNGERAIQFRGDTDLVKNEDGTDIPSTTMKVRIQGYAILDESRPITIFGLNTYPFSDEYEDLGEMVETIASSYYDKTSDDKHKESNEDTGADVEYVDPVKSREEYLAESNK